MRTRISCSRTPYPHERFDGLVVVQRIEIGYGLHDNLDSVLKWGEHRIDMRISVCRSFVSKSASPELLVGCFLQSLV